MELKIIGAGYGRTATKSTQLALNHLGFPCYHMMEVMRSGNSKHAAFWLEVAEQPPGTPHDWQRVFENYSATIDFPSSCVWREQMVAYPDAKVLLTVHPRGAAAWYKSATETIYSVQVLWEFKVLRALLPRQPALIKMIEKLIWQRTLNGTMTDKQAAIAHYEQHIEDVKATVPVSQLLVFSADQGWQPLCDFLGVAVPDIDFPRVNETADMKRVIRKARWILRTLFVLAGAAVGGLIWWLV
ncbi:MAG TPA: sulfotransferase [Gammaproteobacteria bacterium]|nr:sulfotransferase [Gammaproteobacteria bacterium]